MTWNLPTSSKSCCKIGGYPIDGALLDPIRLDPAQRFDVSLCAVILSEGGLISDLPDPVRVSKRLAQRSKPPWEGETRNTSGEGDAEALQTNSPTEK